MKKLKCLLIIIIMLLVGGCDFNNLSTSINRVVDDNKDKLIIHYIDVGQGDATFIEFPNSETMLIDAGEKEYEDKVLDYISALNYDSIDYVIGTHPHSDHIGGLKNVIDNFSVGKVYLPKASNNSKTYTNLLKSIKNKGLAVNTAKAGDNIIDSDNLSVEIIAPNSSDYSSLNDYSVVLRIVYDDRSFLFMGDAEVLSEDEILDNNFDVRSDVIKVGHHGSNTSSGSRFLNKVMPSYAIISVGVDNKYYHPHPSILKRYEKLGSKIYRTDEEGDIILTSDGSGIEIKSKEEVLDSETKFDNTSKLEEESNNLELVSITNPIKLGSEVTLTMKGKKNTSYNIDVYYSSGVSKASGLEDKTSNDEGIVSWTWKVSKNVTPGSYEIVVSDGDISKSINYEVVE